MSSELKFWSSGFRVLDFGFRAWGLGFKVWDFVFRVKGSGFRVSSLGLEIWDLPLLGFRRYDRTCYGSRFGI